MRSLSTSFVALMPVLSLLIVGAGIFGATSLEDFALALAAGLFIGSYSSIFVAAPILAWWKEREPQYRALAERRAGPRHAPAGRRRRRAGGLGVRATPAVGAADERRAETSRATTRRRTVGVPGVPGHRPVGRTIQPRARQQRRRKRESQRPLGAECTALPGPGSTLEVWLTPPRCGHSCATSPTSPSRGSSSATSRRCSRRPTRSRSRSTRWPRRSPTSRSTRSSGSRRAGFVFAAPLAYRRGAGFVPVRKAGQAAVGDRARGVRARVRHRPPRDPPRRRAPGRAGADRRRRDRDRRHRGRRRPGWSSGSAATVVGFTFLLELVALDGRAQLDGPPGPRGAPL